MPKANDLFEEFDLGAAQSSPSSSAASSQGLAGRSSLSRNSGRVNASAFSGADRRGQRASSARPASTMRRKPDPARYAAPSAARDPFDDVEAWEDGLDSVPPRKTSEKSSGLRRANKKSGARSDAKKSAKASAKASEKEEKRARKAAKGGRGNIFGRAFAYLRSVPPSQMKLDAFTWISSHPYVIFLVAVIFIAIGLMFGRYVSFAAALVIAVLGALMSKEDFDSAAYMCYAAAFMDFLIPYLF